MPQTYRVKLSDGREFDVTTEGGAPSEADVIGSIPKGDTPNIASQASIAPSDGGGLSLSALKSAVPAMARGSRAFVDSPAVPRVTAAAGRVLGGLAPIVGGASQAGLGGAAIGMAGSANGAWAGGKTGWFTGKMLQRLAHPVASGLEAVAPYAQALGTLSGAQGVGDLAQMAEPNRRDIGVMGIGATQPRAAGDDKPALLNELLAYLTQRAK